MFHCFLYFQAIGCNKTMKEEYNEYQSSYENEKITYKEKENKTYSGMNISTAKPNLALAKSKIPSLKGQVKVNPEYNIEDESLEETKVYKTDKSSYKEAEAKSGGLPISMSGKGMPGPFTGKGMPGPIAGKGMPGPPGSGSSRSKSIVFWILVIGTIALGIIILFLLVYAMWIWCSPIETNSVVFENEMRLEGMTEDELKRYRMRFGGGS
ncbi:hypothetical protein CDIK_1056 [Cucumispora dikerogammari]|nr:hypothetical protein CDIK_1056 [Cucumispora dikerogammari]